MSKYLALTLDEIPPASVDAMFIHLPTYTRHQCKHLILAEVMQDEAQEHARTMVLDTKYSATPSRIKDIIEAVTTACAKRCLDRIRKKKGQPV